MEKEESGNVKGGSQQQDTEKKLKLYRKTAMVLGLLLAGVLMSQCMGCYSCSSRNNAARYNGFEERIVNSVDEKITDALTEKEVIDGMKVDLTKAHDMDSIGLYRKGKKWGFYNLNTEKGLDGGQIKEAPAYDEVGFFSEGLAAVARDGKIGFVDTKGQLVIPFQYLCRTNKVSSVAFHYGHCKMSGRDGRCGVIDKKGRWSITPIYEGLNLTESCVYATTSSSRIQLNYQGEVMQKDMIVKVEPLNATATTEYYVYYVSEGLGHNRCGLMDSIGHRLTEPMYSRVEIVGQGLCVCYLLDGVTMEVKRF